LTLQPRYEGRTKRGCQFTTSKLFVYTCVELFVDSLYYFHSLTLIFIMSDYNDANKPSLPPEDHARHVEFLEAFLEKLKRRAFHPSDYPKKSPRRLSDEFFDLHYGPDGIKFSRHKNPWLHLYEAWERVGSSMRKAMGGTDLNRHE